MSDKKSTSKERSDDWRNLLPDDEDSRINQADGPEDDDEITPLEEDIFPKDSRPAPKSQALMDIQEAGMTPEEAARASEELAAQSAEEKPTGKKGKAKKKAAKEPAPKSAARSGAENLAVIARFRWIFLLVLALISVAAWAAEAFFSERPYSLEAGAWLALTLLFSLGTIKLLRLPTRSGLAALFWAGSYAISALYGPPEMLFENIPAALGWAGLLTLIVLWMGVAVWRKLGRYRVIDLLLTLVLIYAALAPVGALVSSISSGAALSLKLADLGASPAFLTSHIPGCVWPMSVLVAVILPLCALFSLWDQCSAIRRRGARHGGNFFLALAFVLLLPYAFLSFDQAVSEHPQLARDIRSVWPAAIEHARENQAAATLPAPPVAKPKPAAELPAPTAPTAAPPAAPPTAPAVPDSPSPVQPVLSPAPEPAAPEPVELLPADLAPLPDMPPAASPESAPAELAAPEAPESPAAVTAPVPLTLDERLQNTDLRLDRALVRIEELEREIKHLKQFWAEGLPPAPAAVPDDASAEESQAPPLEDFFKEDNSSD